MGDRLGTPRVVDNLFYFFKKSSDIASPCTTAMVSVKRGGLPLRPTTDADGWRAQVFVLFLKKYADVIEVFSIFPNREDWDWKHRALNQNSETDKQGGGLGWVAASPAELLMWAAPADAVVTTAHGSHRGHVHWRHIKGTFDEDNRRPRGFSMEIYTFFDWRELQFFESFRAVKN